MHEGQEIELHTELVVREDSLTLYGFETAHARSVFRTLLTVSGVGPKLALAVLAVLGAGGAAAAVAAAAAQALAAGLGSGARGAGRRPRALSGTLPARAGLPGAKGGRAPG